MTMSSLHVEGFGSYGYGKGLIVLEEGYDVASVEWGDGAHYEDCGGSITVVITAAGAAGGGGVSVGTTTSSPNKSVTIHIKERWFQ
mmetsp:Transcript_3023/g.4984  ORF Transcript_3023/g.4984 Transcript_3023/m.4984 type:complete len:86 (-) Transcript_3023:478-735(-)